MKTVILCADDYGQNEFISQAIITLLEQKRLSATSCMTNMPAWQVCASALLPYQGKADVGLHFNLTEGPMITRSLETLPLSTLISRAYLGGLEKVKIEAELNAQLDAFSAALGRLPDFLDGHQHVHQLPVIRDIVFKVYEKRLRRQNSYIRCVDNDKSFWQWPSIKKSILRLLGSRRFKKELIKRNIPYNKGFFGIYAFKRAAKYGVLFPRFLRHSEEGTLIMCHPGYFSDDVQDPIAAARVQELNYFVSDKFLQDCVAAQVRVGRFALSSR